MTKNTWEVHLPTGFTERVQADRWKSEDGLLVFYDVVYRSMWGDITDTVAVYGVGQWVKAARATQ